ncbi:MAG: pyrroloquinoline quinone precursor peptide PqqA [Myxococcales bacterium]|jgi:coenzyme PQQ precursor peptide PqqA|nr:pyrroloquinoline quinone precursor peptide PqqA [Myxococcales bacterium]MDH3842403.1 pyrroloquinoline quinone precursor peptide PqqA [Myxococcales bacterium]
MSVKDCVAKKAKRKWVKPAYKDIRLGFEYTLYAMTR